MVRFLSLLILSLNTWSDVRRRITLSVTAVPLIGLASFVVISMATDASSPFVWLSHEQAGQSGVNVHSGTTSRKLSPHFSPTSSSLVGRRVEPPLKAFAIEGKTGIPDQDSKTVSSQQVFAVQPGSNTPPDNADSESATPTPSSTVPNSLMPTISLQLASAQPVCQQGQEVIVVPSADVKFQSPLSSDGLLTWQWEIRLDTGSASAGASPPIDTTSHTQQIAAGTTDVSLSGVQPNPLLGASVSLDYGYSFRLHVTTPSDSESDWVTVPQAVAGC